MRQLLALVLVAALVGLAFLFLLPGEDGPTEPVTPGGGTEALAPAPRTGPEAPEAPRAADEAPAQVASERTSIEAMTEEGPAEEPTEEPEGRALVTGRFLLPSGAPAVGASLELRGFQANTTRVQEHGLPEDWTDKLATTDADGRFAIRLDPPRAYQFFLEASLAGHAEESWRWGSLGVAEQRDLGTVTMRRGGELEVRVVDAAGAALTEGWRVLADAPAGDAGGDGRDETRVSGELDEGAGLFRLSGLPAGPVVLKARHPLAGWVDGPPAQVEPGRVNRVEIPWVGPALDRRIEVSTFARPYFILAGDTERVRLTGNGVELEAGVTEGTSQSFRFDDLEPGSYTVSIDHELFEPFRQDGVEPGQGIDAHLVPSGRLVLDLTDGVTGEPILAATLSLRLDFMAGWSPNTFQIHSGELPADGLLPPVPPGDTTLIVEAPGHAELELPVLGLAPFETRPLAVSLVRGAALEGVVLDAAGAPIPEAQVLLMPPGAAPAVPRTWSSSMDTGYVGALEERRTDADGRFRFAGLAPGAYDVHAAGTPWLLASATGLDLGPGEERDLTLRLPEGAGLELVVGDAVDLPEGFEAVVVTKAARAMDMGPFGDFLDDVEGRSVLTPTGPGTWSGRDLPPGPAVVTLGRGEVVVPFDSGGSYERGRVHQLGEVELEVGRVATLEAELGDQRPGEVLVEVLADGLPQPGLRVIVRGSGAFGGMALTDAQGFALVTGLYPGEVSVEVRRAGVGNFHASGQVRVESGQRTQTRIDTSVVAGRLRVLDETGAPHAERDILLAGGGMSSRPKTDADGWVDVLLRPGVVQIRLQHFDKQARKILRADGEVAWPPAGGEAEVALVPRE